MFDITNITEENLFVGDIYIIERTFKHLIDEVKKVNPTCENLSPICFTQLAKEKAILVKLDDNKYVDLDGIRSCKDIEIINELLKSRSINNNIILIEGTIDPYVGELYIAANTLTKVKNMKKVLKKKLNTLN